MPRQQRITYVPIRTLPEGSRFLRPNGKGGTLIRVGLGSALVEIERDEERTFTPTTGPNAGKEVRIRNSSERVTWSLESPVLPAN